MRKSNKILAVIMALVIVLGTVPMMTAGAAKHTHSYVQESSTEATCEADGVTVFKCSCGDEKKEVVKALGHDYIGEAKKKNDTVHTQKCGECNKTIEVKHNFKGEKEVKRDPTCTAVGKAEVMCTECDATTIVDVPATGHSYTGTVTSASSTRHKGTCSICGANKYEAHNWGEGVVTKAPECYKSGEMTYTCDDCGATRTERLAAAHTYPDWTEVDGGKYHSHKCTKCTKSIKEAHNFTSEITVEPDCVSKGELTLTCEKYDSKGNVVGCGYTTTEEIATVAHKINKNTYKEYSALKHTGTCSVCYEDIKEECTYTEVKDKAVAATCDKDGSKTSVCVCGREKVEKIDKLGHKWGEWKETKPATETAEGEKERVCTVKDCGAKETEKIAKLEAAGLVGDVNADKKVSSVDALMILKYVANTGTLTDAQKAAADIVGNKDGVKASDARKVLEIVAGVSK